MKNRMMSMMVVALLAGWTWAESTDKNAGCGNGPVMPEIFGKGETVLFQGDSITHGGRMGDMNHYLGHGYAAEIAMRSLAYSPLLGVEFANRGVSGDTTRKLLARWDRDGVAFTAGENGYGRAFDCSRRGTKRTADWLSLLIGVNDRRLGDDAHSVPAAEYARNLDQLVARSLSANPKLKLVLCEPFRVPQNPDVVMMQYQDAVAALAWRLNCPLVKFQRFFNETLPAGNPHLGYWSWDGVHPTYAAHMRMADEWLSTVAEFRAKGRSKNPAVYPRAKLENDSYNWWDRHARILREQKQMNPEIVFIGDSITHFWAGRTTIGGADADARWKKAFGAYRTLNAGFGWDRTQNVLWRLDHGLLDGIAPKVVSIMIGTNNVRGPGPVENTAEEIFEAIQVICARVKEKVPSATIVLSNILPRGPTADDLYRTKPSQVNALLARWAPTQPQLVYVNVYNEFLGPDGRLGRDMMGDYCHPTDKGYDVWAAALLPHFRRLLGR